MADHERTINNLRRTRFFPPTTTFNQGAHFIGLRWPPRLNKFQLNRGPIFAPADLPNPPDFKHLSSPTFLESEGVQWFPEGEVKRCKCFLCIQCVEMTPRQSRLQSEYREERLICRFERVASSLSVALCTVCCM